MSLRPIIFGRILTLAFSMFAGLVFAQLPPTIHRIEQRDSAVDSPEHGMADALVPSVCESFGNAWSATNRPILLRGGPSTSRRPFTVTLWAKLNSPQTFNILLAHEPKSSPRHWELYTFAGNGRLSLYLPGNPAGEIIQSAESVTDGAWHYLGLTMGEDFAELFIDGRSAARGAIDRPESAIPDDAPFGVGTLAENAPTCDGLLDDVRMTEGIRPLSADTVPSKPEPADSQTILYLSFDAPMNEESDTRWPNDSACREELIAPTQTKTSNAESFSFADYRKKLPTIRVTVEGRLAAVIDAGFSDRLEHLFPSGGTEIEVAPNEKPAKNIPTQSFDRAAFDRRSAELRLTTVRAENWREGVFAFWGERFIELQNQISGVQPLVRGAKDQVYDPETLLADGERFPVQIILRRTEALADFLGDTDGAEPIRTDLNRLTEAVRQEMNGESPNVERLTVDYFLACALCRQLLFLHAECESLDKILFLARACYAGSRLTNESNSDRIGGHFATQIYGFNTIRGGGLFVLSDWREKNPKVQNLLKDTHVEATSICSRLSGRALDSGSFYAPELSYDGKTVYFSHCGSTEHRWVWSLDTTWNIFKLELNGQDGAKRLTQLTDSAYNDFDVCELPSGRLAFVSERRGGFIRCFGENADLRVTTAVLHGMKSDGSDIYPLSFFETSEWQPSVDNNGMLIYTRWDYTDRENCLGSTYWTCAPDGRNPRSPHGNYPQPWFTFWDDGSKKHGDHRFGRCDDAPSGLPMTEMQFRAIPNSHRSIFTAAPHHGETFGSLCVLDLHQKNDFHMSQVRRLTPYTPFPESESPGRRQYQYGSPWPLSEDVFLCNRWEDLILLDRFGNEELLCEREILPIGYDPRLRLTEPIPLRPRSKPAVIPQQTSQGEDFVGVDSTATIGVVNVHIADLPLPADRPVKRLRVLQVIPKPNPWMDKPWIGYATENTPRIPLGTVPVESDGSVYFEAPAGKQLIFQILDKKNRAIQTMRAVAFVHPGEKLLCTGCHESPDESVENVAEKVMPIAFGRAPSKLEPECGPVEPMNFYRRVKPILETSCLPCHTEKNIAPTAMDHEDLRPWVYYFSGGMNGTTVQNGPHGGSRSCPGRVGASESKLGAILFDEHHLSSVSDEARHALILWLDANAPRLGAFHNEEAQMRGEPVWPILDTEKPSTVPPNR